MSPYKLAYGKNCHLPIELEKEAYWEIKELNLDLDLAREERLFQLRELEESRLWPMRTQNCIRKVAKFEMMQE